jgi:hypothetical protein
MRSALFFALLALIGPTIRWAAANPIALQCGEPSALIAETVNIAVHKRQSVVTGKYSFRVVDDGCPHFVDESLTIKVPVIVRDRQSLAALKSSTAVTVTFGRRTLHPVSASMDSPLYDLPAGWKLCFFHCEIPRPAFQSVFMIALRYNQPHLPGNLVPYYPIHPPERWAPKSAVRYSLEESGSLSLVSKGERVFEIQPTRLSIQPQHHKLILVRVNKS